MRLWERPAYCVVLGRANRVDLNVNRPACEAAGVPVLRRASGGGTVLLGPGALCWSLVLPVGPPRGVPGDIPAVTAAIMHRFADAVRPLVPGAGVDGTSDLTVPGPAGEAGEGRGERPAVVEERRCCTRARCSMTSTSRRSAAYLSAPERQPDYRAGRDHRAFVTNLPVSREELVAALKTAFGATGPPAEVPLGLMQSLYEERYGDPAWHLRR